ncbi:MAG: hypothetical protein WC454_07880 [Phycisphaerae bacterium]|jgi:hypothetical protein
MKRTTGSYLAHILAMTSLFKTMFPQAEPKRASWNLKPFEKGIRNPKDPIKKAAITRRRKAQKLSELSKSKRRTIYYYNLRHSVKMYA